MNPTIEYHCSYGKEKLKQVQQILWDMYLEVSEVFDQNDIRYFLTYGTLIGAVRHQGMIPWDDDLDICVMKDDYEQAIELLRKYLSDRFVVHDKKTDPIYWLEFSKIRYKNSYTECTLWPEDNDFKYTGICLDIYRCWTEDQSRHNWKYKKQKLYLKRYCENLRLHKNTFRSMIGIILRGCTTVIYGLMNTLATKKPMCVMDPELIVPPFDAACLMPFIQAKFNGRMCPVPNNPDAVLRSYYGNYMQLPPVEKRLPHYNMVEIK